MIAPKYNWNIRDNFPGPDSAGIVDAIAMRRGFGGEGGALELPYEDAFSDPAGMIDFDAAVEKIVRQGESGGRIVIYGDYDADGVTSSAILACAMRDIGWRYSCRLPHREKDGYGLTEKIVREILSRGDLLLAVDNGSNAVEAVAAAKAIGVEVVILDHHEISEDVTFHATLVNPKRDGQGSPAYFMSAAGLAWKTAKALYARKGMEQREKWLMDMAAIGTVADRVPLVGENRSLVQWGMRTIMANRRAGLRALMRAARLSAERIDADEISFKIAPRINAAGRMDDPEIAFELLMAGSAEEAEAKAARLEDMNNLRRRLAEKHVSEIRNGLKGKLKLPEVIFAAGNWPVGIAGILAGRISEETRRPALVASQNGDMYVGSLRSGPGTDAVSILGPVEKHLDRYGGHKKAAGFSFRKEKLETLREHFESFALNEPSSGFEDLDVDAAVEPSAVGPELAASLRSLEPFGEANERPVFAALGMELVGIQPLGQRGDHSRFVLSHESLSGGVMQAMAFKHKPAEYGAEPRRVDVAFTVEPGKYYGGRSVDVKVVDIRTSDEGNR